MSTEATAQLPQSFIGDVLVWDGLRDALLKYGYIGQRADGAWTWTAAGHRWLVWIMAANLHVHVPPPFMR